MDTEVTKAKVKTSQRFSGGSAQSAWWTCAVYSNVFTSVFTFLPFTFFAIFARSVHLFVIEKLRTLMFLSITKCWWCSRLVLGVVTICGETSCSVEVYTLKSAFYSCYCPLLLLTKLLHVCDVEWVSYWHREQPYTFSASWEFGLKYVFSLVRHILNCTNDKKKKVEALTCSQRKAYMFSYMYSMT